MERIPSLLHKIQELYDQQNTKTTIDIDLMMDYTRVIYAELLEWRSRATPAIVLEQQQPHTPPPVPQSAPTISEITIAMDKAHSELASTSTHAPSIDLGENVQYFDMGEKTRGIPVQYTPSSDPYFQPNRPDIRKQIGINDKYLFISELFGNDKEAYETVMTELNSFDTADEAQNWLKAAVHEQFKWSDDSDTVQSFYTVLMQFFSAR
jgi:hypothetical protein